MSKKTQVLILEAADSISALDAMKLFAAFLMLAAACLAADPLPPVTRIKIDRFAQTYSILANVPTVVKPGMGESFKDDKKVVFSSVLMLSSNGDPTLPELGLVFRRRCFFREWSFFSEGSMLLDGVVTRIPVAVTVNGDQSQKEVPIEEDLVLHLNLDQMKVFIAAKECAFKFGRTELDLTMKMRQPVIDVVQRYRAELAAGTFNEFGKTKARQ